MKFTETRDDLAPVGVLRRFSAMFYDFILCISLMMVMTGLYMIIANLILGDTYKEMNDSGVDLYSVREGIDSSTQMGKTMFGMVGVFSEFELQVRKDRVQRGIDHYRKTHKTWGRKKSITDNQIDQVHGLRKSGLSIRKISSEVGISTGSVSKVLSTCY